NGCLAVAWRRDRLPPNNSRAWLPESATEWIDSASIEDDPVNRNAANLVTAMPMLAPRAARIARVPPPALNGFPPQRTVRGSSAGELLHLLDRGDGGRIQSVGQGEVDRGEVRHGNQRRQPFQRG